MIKKSDLKIVDEQKITLPASDFSFEDETIDAEMLSNIMIEKAAESGVIGLSCPQVGINLRMFVMIAGVTKIKVFNPKIVEYSEDTSLFETSSAFHRLMNLNIKRSNSIKVEYQNEKGELVSTTFSGMSSDVFQQMYDYLEGVTMRDRVSKLKWDRATESESKKIRKIIKRYNLK